MREKLMQAIIIDEDRMIGSLLIEYLKVFSFTAKYYQQIESIDEVTKHNECRLIVLDYHSTLPDQEKVYQILRNTEGVESISIVLMTGKITQAEIAVLKADNFAQILIKPFNQEIFHSAIETILAGTVKNELKIPSDQPVTEVYEEDDFEGKGEDDALMMNAWKKTLSDLHREQESIKSKFITNPSWGEESRESQEETKADQKSIGKDPAFQIENSEINNVMVIDRDEAILNLMTSYFNQKGVFSITVASDGKKGWELIKANPVDLIISEWKLEKLSGLCLYNRIRQHPDKKYTPMIILSKDIEKYQAKILSESPFTIVLEKPFQISIFRKAIGTLLAESLTFNTVMDRVSNMIEGAFLTNKINEFVNEVCSNLPGSLNHLCYLADFYARTEQTKYAEGLYRSILSLSPKNTSALTGLARTLYLTDRKDQAQTLLNCADALSPNSVERLCLLGKIQLNKMSPQKARESFLKAHNIDPEDQKATNGLYVAETMIEHIEHTEQHRLGFHFVSSLNTIGVALAQKGKIDDAQRLYKSAIIFVNNRESLGKLYYNLGISYLRDKKSQYALVYFREADKIFGGKNEKVSGYLERLNKQKKES